MDAGKSRLPTEGRERELGTAHGLPAETEGWDAAMTDDEADEFLGIARTRLVTGRW